MGQVLIRNVEDGALQTLRERARKNGRSLEAELRELIHDAGRRTRDEALAILDDIRARSRPWQPGEKTTTEMIREDRDRR